MIDDNMVFIPHIIIVTLVLLMNHCVTSYIPPCIPAAREGHPYVFSRTVGRQTATFDWMRTDANGTAQRVSHCQTNTEPGRPPYCTPHEGFNASMNGRDVSILTIKKVVRWRDETRWTWGGTSGWNSCFLNVFPVCIPPAREGHPYVFSRTVDRNTAKFYWLRTDVYGAAGHVSNCQTNTEPGRPPYCTPREGFNASMNGRNVSILTIQKVVRRRDETRWIWGGTSVWNSCFLNAFLFECADIQIINTGTISAPAMSVSWACKISHVFFEPKCYFTFTTTDTSHSETYKQTVPDDYLRQTTSTAIEHNIQSLDKECIMNLPVALLIPKQYSWTVSLLFHSLQPYYPQPSHRKTSIFYLSLSAVICNEPSLTSVNNRTVIISMTCRASGFYPQVTCHSQYAKDSIPDDKLNNIVDVSPPSCHGIPKGCSYQCTMTQDVTGFDTGSYRFKMLVQPILKDGLKYDVDYKESNFSSPIQLMFQVKEKGERGDNTITVAGSAVGTVVVVLVVVLIVVLIARKNGCNPKCGDKRRSKGSFNRQTAVIQDKEVEADIQNVIYRKDDGNGSEDDFVEIQNDIYGMDIANWNDDRVEIQNDVYGMDNTNWKDDRVEIHNNDHEYSEINDGEIFNIKNGKVNNPGPQMDAKRTNNVLYGNDPALGGCSGHSQNITQPDAEPVSEIPSPSPRGVQGMTSTAFLSWGIQ